MLVLVGALLMLALPASAQLEPQPTNFENQEEKKNEPPKLTKMPALLEAVQPLYPEKARAEGRQGDVILLIAIDAEGLVSRVDVKQSAGDDLDFAAMGAATNFIFSPAEWNGRPGPVAIEFKQAFQLDVVLEEVPTEEALETEASAQAAESTVEGEEGPINFVGIVREAGSKVALEGVEVTVEIELPIPEGTDTEAEDFLPPMETRTILTDAEGRFAYRGIPLGEHKISFAMTGYETSFIIESFEENKRTESVVYLQPLDSNAFITVIREQRAKKEVAKVALTREEVRRIPGTFGDPLRVIENLPGLARAPFIGGALIVRGANPADTGVYFDGVPIPILYHFGGLKSVVNAEFLEEISFYPGGFGAYYGRATAGIVDVESRDLRMKNFRGFTDVSVIDTSFFFGGPIKIGELPEITVAAAARRSYIDAIVPYVLDTFFPNSGVVASPIYWDYQLKAQIEPWTGQTFSLFAFGSSDDLKVTGDTGGNSINLGVAQNFHRIVGRWESRFSNGIIHTMQPFVGVTGQDIGFGSNIGLGANIGLGTTNWGLRDDLRFKPTDFFEVAVGVDYLGQTFATELSFPLPLEVGSFPRIYPRVRGLQNLNIKSGGMTNAAAVYAEGIFQPVKALKIVPSVRAEYTHVLLNGYEQPDGTVEDDYSVGFWNVDPRITGRVDILRGTTLKGAVGVYRQPPATNQLFPANGNPFITQPRALQMIGGVEQALTRDLNLDVQIYYTNRDLLVQGTDELIPKGNGEFDRVVYNNGGLGRTYGVEFLLRHELTEYFFGWIAYTLSRTEIDLDEDREAYNLTDFDQTHILTIVGQANLPWGITLGTRFRLVSGNPTTIPMGSVHDLDTTDYLRLNQPQRAARLPAFHQLDIRVDRKFVFDNFSITPYLDLLNAYYPVRWALNEYVDPSIPANNAEAYQDDYRFRQRQQIDSLPIIPNFGIQGEF